MMSGESCFSKPIVARTQNFAFAESVRKAGGGGQGQERGAEFINTNTTDD